MRSLLILSIALMSAATNVAAQTPSRWTISAGPEWSPVTPTNTLWGMRLRAEYDLTKPTSVFGLRLEGGGRWGPTQSYFHESVFGTQSGTEQRIDLMLGLTAGLWPFPRARFSPYVAMGIFGRQAWQIGSYFDQDSVFGNRSAPYSSRTSGDFIGTLGLGLRARIGGRSVQLEVRRLYDQNGVSFGTRLPF